MSVNSFITLSRFHIIQYTENKSEGVMSSLSICSDYVYYHAVGCHCINQWSTVSATRLERTESATLFVARIRNVRIRAPRPLSLQLVEGGAVVVVHRLIVHQCLRYLSRPSDPSTDTPSEGLVSMKSAKVQSSIVALQRSCSSSSATSRAQKRKE